MRMGDAYIIVYSVTDKSSFEKASELRIQLRRARQSENIPIILVGNKSDLVRSREVSVDGECDDHEPVDSSLHSGCEISDYVQAVAGADRSKITEELDWFHLGSGFVSHSAAQAQATPTFHSLL